MQVKACIKCCARASAKKYAAENPEKRAAYRIENPDKCAGASAAWAKANPEKRKSIKNKYVARNGEKIASYSATYWADNKDAIKAKCAKYHAENKVQRNAASADWERKNRDRRLELNQNRRTRKKLAGGKLSMGIRRRLYALQKGLCPCCSQPLEANCHLDHIIPLTLGGTNTDQNVQLLRAECNQKKYNKHPIDYMQSKGFLL
jgi:5-methylcytosine-specific restriction endonuclease McrA